MTLKLIECVMSVFYCSYVIQNFFDTFRQSVIDVLQGNITHGDELQFNKTLEVLASLAGSPIDLPDYYHYGSLNNELQLIESLIKPTRCLRKSIMFTKHGNAKLSH